MDIYRRMEEVFRRIPDGCVTTYGQIALLCGAPRHSRQVGYALRTNRLGDVPAFKMCIRDRYSGFAFGLGLERIAMLKYGINNIKMLFESDLRLSLIHI